jgi:hypothetical protein
MAESSRAWSHQACPLTLRSTITFGSPPYLELPAIGWDTYQRSGRGYPEGRVRGENAAAFLNFFATSDPITRGFEKVYAVGVEGAKRLFLGTGEAF